MTDGGYAKIVAHTSIGLRTEESVRPSRLDYQIRYVDSHSDEIARASESTQRLGRPVNRVVLWNWTGLDVRVLSNLQTLTQVINKRRPMAGCAGVQITA